jgi:hypothetical protein
LRRGVIRSPVTATTPAFIARDSDALPTYNTVWSMVQLAIQNLAEDYGRQIDELRTENDELRRALEAKASRDELDTLRDMKSAFAEVKAQAAECSAKVERLDFSLTRIAADRKGEPGRDGKDGKTGARGLRGEIGRMGPAGIAGAEISAWMVDAPLFEVRIMMSDGRKGPTLNLFVNSKTKPKQLTTQLFRPSFPHPKRR